MADQPDKLLADDLLIRKATSGAVQGRAPVLNAIKIVLLILLAATMTVPFVWMLLASF